MSFTDYAENKLIDFKRGQGLSLPSSWRLTPLSAAIDGSVTEVVGSGIARFTLTSSLDNWSGTQGPGTTLTSNGSSHQVSNNVQIDMGTATGAVGTVTHVGFFDALSGGNCWIAAELADPIVTSNGVALKIAEGNLVLSLGASGGMSDYLCNKLFDRLLRAQAFAYPASTYQAALTAAPNNAGGGVEVGGGVGYSRLPLASSMDELSGTQAAGTTSASSGTSGRTSNNLLRQFADPAGSWGDVGWTAFYDAASGGNLLWWTALAAVKSVRAGFPLGFQPNSIGFTFD